MDTNYVISFGGPSHLMTMIMASNFWLGGGDLTVYGGGLKFFLDGGTGFNRGGGRLGSDVILQLVGVFVIV